MARRPQGRVQVDDPLRRLPEQRVRPMAPDVFVGAPSVSGAGAGFRDLADALSGFAGSVGGLEKVFEARKKQDQDKAEQEWRILPREERERRFQAGVGPNGETIRENPAISKAQGIDYATKTLDEFQAGIDAGKFDMTGDRNVDEELAAVAGPLDDSFKGNPYLQQGFREEVIKRRDALMKKQTELRLEAKTKRTKEGVQTMLRTTFSRTTEAGLDTDGKLAEINKLRNQMTKGPMAVGLPPQEIDNMTFSLADEVAETDPQLARKLLTEPRTGPDGEVVGPLGYKGDNLEASERIMKRVVAQEKKNVETAVTEKVTDTYLTRGLKGESIADMTDFNDKHQDGSDLKISKDQIKKAVFEKWKVRSDELASRTNEPPEKANAREIQELSRMGITNPDWEARFKALPGQVTEENLQDPDKQKELLETFQLYQQGRAGPKFFLDAHLDKNSSKLLDLAYVAKTRLGQTDDQALMSAMRVTEMSGDDDSLGSLSRSISKKVEGSYGPGSSYARALKETATTYAKLGGMGADEAIEAAEARLSESGAEVNGSYVEIPRDPKSGKPIVLPDDFPALAEQTIERWFSKYGNPSEYKPSDLTLRGSPNGLFEIVDKLGNPVLGVNLEGATYASPILKLSDFLETKRKNEDTNMKGMVADQNLEQTINNEGYMAGVFQYLDDLKSNDPSLGDSIKAHATVLGKLAKKGFRGLGNAMYPKTPEFQRGNYRLPNSADFKAELDKLVENGAPKQVFDALTGIPSVMDALENGDSKDVALAMAAVIPFPAAKIAKAAVVAKAYKVGSEYSKVAKASQAIVTRAASIKQDGLDKLKAAVKAAGNNKEDVEALSKALKLGEGFPVTAARAHTGYYESSGKRFADQATREGFDVEKLKKSEASHLRQKESMEKAVAELEEGLSAYEQLQSKYATIKLVK